MGFVFGKLCAASSFLSTAVAKTDIQRNSKSLDQQKKKKKSESTSSRSSSIDTLKSIETVSTSNSKRCGISANVEIVDAWMRAWKNQNLKMVQSMSAADCEYLVQTGESTNETMKVRLQDFIEQMKLTYASFPDFDTDWDSMIDNGKRKPDTVIIKNFVSRGTHTGEPYAFGPYEPMPARGIKIQDHPVDVLVYVDKHSGKISKVLVLSRPNQQTGPAVYYLQVGGLIP